MSNATTLDTLPCGTSTYDDLVRGWIKRKFAGVRHGAKQLATLGNVSTRTAENWVQLRTTPTKDDLINLCVECDDLVELLITEVQKRKALKGSK